MSDLKISVKNHNKKRNSGLLFEFIVCELAKAVNKNNTEKAKKCNELIKKYFNQKTELFKEYRIINSIIKTTVSSESVANSIMSEMKQYVNNFNKKKLNDEKNNLIYELNKNFGEEIYEQEIKNYKIYATSQLLINNMMSECPDPVISGKYKDVIVNYLITEKAEQEEKEDLNESIIQSSSDDKKVNLRIISKLMMERINKKYGSSLTGEQKVFLKEYVINNNSSSAFLDKSFQSLKTKLVESLNRYSSKENSETLKQKIGSLVENLNKDYFDNKNKNLYFTKCLEMIKLNNEINGNN